MFDVQLFNRCICRAAYGALMLGGSPAGASASGERAMQVQPKTTVETVVISGAWSRPALKSGTGGVYMTITNSGARAVRISRATSLDARAVELHESSDHNGMTRMQQLPALEIASGASVTLKPGGKHFMLIGLRRAFAIGDTMRVVLLVEDPKIATATKSGAPSARVITALAAVRVP
jgi:periplasmic copper chaperone A